MVEILQSIFSGTMASTTKCSPLGNSTARASYQTIWIFTTNSGFTDAHFHCSFRFWITIFVFLTAWNFNKLYLEIFRASWALEFSRSSRKSLFQDPGVVVFASCPEHFSLTQRCPFAFHMAANCQGFYVRPSYFHFWYNWNQFGSTKLRDRKFEAI